ncbi:F-box protein CPR30 [Striga hermonthica]|uniref:F-box protein CPR30 n=1 Tax=Striga hermonthica TaxID=68872 RepID=A0A9N7MX32_STRHE|nr:F-box protein CPR30 [Striga hermonthica]
MRIHSNSTLAKLRSISKHTNLRAWSVFTGAASPPTTSSSLPDRKKGHRHKEFLVATHLEEEGVEYCRISTSDERTYKVRQLKFPDTERSTFFYPDSYCNELMLASSASYSMMHAALWNPTTDEVMSLPPSTAWRPLIEASSIIYYGLGFDPSSQDYKSDVTDVNHTIVRIMGLFNNDKLFLGDEKSEVVLWDCTTRELKYLRICVDRWFSIIAPYVARHMPIRRKNISPPCTRRDVGPRSSEVNSPHRATTKYVIDRGEFQDKLCFCHLIVEHHQKNGLVGTHSRLDFTFFKHTDYFLPIDSCRSLVLVSTTNKESDLQCALWNPTTNEVKPLPESSVPLPPYTACTEINSHAFGFDPVFLDYKVVRLLEFYDEDHDEVRDYFRAEIYSLKNDSWKEIARPSRLLVSGLSHGSLASLVYRTPDFLVTAERPFEFEVWVWNDDGSWTRVVSQIITGAAVDDVLGIFNNDKLFLRDMKGDVLVFDLLTSELTNIGSGVEPRECKWIYPYVESEESIGTYLP